ncbi:arabinose-5-phosphate isomerase [Phyllobacterium sp. YR620]|jgi:arabinose-5-phosphate isomerase|uniref:KpsF/GutQ family sugar-phosphate isomerase n=1 Tax=Phyllobacterium pellucidum TaxID=2740464 RepID=A0A849VQF0_9HYPH|nr:MULTISPECIES: KpsF/GutQ family sugar-phosphate isomerase [Phyllobacterium]NTS32162.1 KpsF/GutQ family sugar-phosphate isomerase [Phyllobacterium pellucidum]UGY09577.1 KpsF/GutQ family sugar-phosphate isomerase [Phyllobacterium sp. T1018]SDO77891.1 arabinose-5-phosphate isomerase [Phyllobacterium sp. YR620]SFJ53577.1 arabinose-5-phosphate isomerase [Phyllobacterium sp. CL33Tsu]
MQAINHTDLDKSAAVESAKRTISTETDGLVALSEALGGPLAEPFCRAIEKIASIRGRIIVTGVGKSGHIGSKLAATFASTGTPAFFVHPSEANHGDLGMIAVDDAIIALSWSGETAELKGIVSYAMRFRIPLIAVTAGETSALANAADVVLLLPRVTEACPHGLAPTTSTLMQLAMGDAIAIALLEARGFTAGDFKTFHPGGSLGASLTHVREIMHSGDQIPLVPLGTPIPDAMKVFAAKRFGCIAVQNEEGTLAGIITDGDLSRNLHRNLIAMNVEDIMTRDPKTVPPTMLASAALALLNQHNIGALIVTEKNYPVGIVHFHDLLRIGAA